MSARRGRKSLAEKDTLDRIHVEACRLLSEGFTGKQVAEKLSIRQSTLSKWIQHWPSFQLRLGEFNAMKWAESANMAGKSAHAALILATKVLANDEEATRNRLQAASILLNHRRQLEEISIRSRQVDALQRRLDAIEERYRQQHAVDVTYDVPQHALEAA